MSPIRIGLVGDFQRGKSTLVNCLLNRNIATIGDGTATTHAPVSYYYGENERVEYLSDTNEKRIIDLCDWDHIDACSHVQSICVFINHELLNSFTIIDMPGLGANEDDNKRALATIKTLDCAIVITTNAKSIGGDLSQEYFNVSILKKYGIPYYLVLNCKEFINGEGFPGHPSNCNIMEENERILSFYKPLSFPFSNAHHLIVNFIWYWYAIQSTDPENTVIEDIVRIYHLDKLSKPTIVEKSNFPLIQRIFSMDNKLNFELRREIKQQIKDATQSIREEVCPIGTIQAFAFQTIPEGWLLCDGSALRISDFPELYSIINNTFGDAEDGTFIIPDLRGRFIRGWDENHIVDKDRKSFGSYQEDAISEHSHSIKEDSITVLESGEHTHTAHGVLHEVGSWGPAIETFKYLYGEGRDSGVTTTAGNHTHKVKISGDNALSGVKGVCNSVRVASENRPKNIALVYCIKAESVVHRSFSQSDNIGMHCDIRHFVNNGVQDHDISISPPSGEVLGFSKVSHFSEGRVRCFDHGGWCYMMPGKLSSNHYEDAHDFSEKRAAVKMDGKWGFIDYEEHIVIPCIYSKVGDFAEGVAYFEKNIELGGKNFIERGFVDYDGHLVLSLTENYSGYGLQFDDRFNYGLFRIYSQVHSEWINHKGGIVIKYQGKSDDGSNQDISVEFGSISNWFAYGKISKKKVVYYSALNEEEQQMSSDFFGTFIEYDISHLRFDVKRNIIEEFDGENQPFEIETPRIVEETSIQYSTILPLASMVLNGVSYKRAPVKRNNLWGFIDEAGKEVIPCVFADVQNYSEGYAAVYRNNVWFFIDVFGKPI